MSKVLTLPLAVQFVGAAIAKNGADYVYPEHRDKRYTNLDGTPSCIVGYVVADFAPEELSKLKDAEWGETESENEDGVLEAYAVSFGVDALVGYVDFEMDRDAELYLSMVQDKQDLGRPWGDAHKEALEYVQEYRNDR